MSRNNKNNTTESSPQKNESSCPQTESPRPVPIEVTAKALYEALADQEQVSPAIRDYVRRRANVESDDESTEEYTSTLPSAVLIEEVESDSDSEVTTRPSSPIEIAGLRSAVEVHEAPREGKEKSERDPEEEENLATLAQRTDLSSEDWETLFTQYRDARQEHRYRYFHQLAREMRKKPPPQKKSESEREEEVIYPHYNALNYEYASRLITARKDQLEIDSYRQLRGALGVDPAVGELAMIIVSEIAYYRKALRIISEGWINEMSKRQLRRLARQLCPKDFDHQRFSSDIKAAREWSSPGEFGPIYWKDREDQWVSKRQEIFGVTIRESSTRVRNLLSRLPQEPVPSSAPVGAGLDDLRDLKLATDDAEPPEEFTFKDRARAWWNTTDQLTEATLPRRWKLWFWYRRRDSAEFKAIKLYCDAVIRAWTHINPTHVYANRTVSYYARPSQLEAIRAMHIRKHLQIPVSVRLTEDQWKEYMMKLNEDWDFYNREFGWGFGKIPLPVPTGVASSILSAMFLFVWGCSPWSFLVFSLLNWQNLCTGMLFGQIDVIGVWASYALFCAGLLNPMVAAALWAVSSVVILGRTYWWRAFTWQYNSAIVQGSFFAGLAASILGTGLYLGSKCALRKKTDREQQSSEREFQGKLHDLASLLGVRNLKDLMLMVTATPKLFELGNRLYYMFFNDVAHYAKSSPCLTVVERDGVVRVEFERSTTLDSMGIRHGYIEKWSKSEKRFFVLPVTQYLHVPLDDNLWWAAHERLLGKGGKYYVPSTGAKTGVFIRGILHISHDPVKEGAAGALGMTPAATLGSPSLPATSVRVGDDRRGVGASDEDDGAGVFSRPDYEDSERMSSEFEERVRRYMGEERYAEFLKREEREAPKRRRLRRTIPRPSAKEEREEQGAFEDVSSAILDWVAAKRDQYGWWIGAAFAGAVFVVLLLVGYKLAADRSGQRETQARKTRSRSDAADLVYGYFRDRGISLQDIIAYSTNDLENGRPRRVIVTGLGEEETAARERFEKDLAAATHPPLFFLRSTRQTIRPLVKPGELFYKLSRETRGGDGNTFQREMQAFLTEEEKFTQEVFNPITEAEKDDPEEVKRFLEEFRKEDPALADALTPATTTFGIKAVTEKVISKARDSLKLVEDLVAGTEAPQSVDSLKGLWQEHAFKPIEQQINLAAPTQQLIQLYKSNTSQLLGTMSKVNGGLLVPRHYLPVIRSTNIYLLGNTGTTQFTETFRIASDPESFPWLPIGDDLAWIPLHGLHEALRKQLGAFKEIRLATKDEYKSCDHFRYVGWDPRRKDVIPVNTILQKDQVTEEAFGEAKPRFVVRLAGYPGSCGSLLIACDKNDTSFGVCGIHVEGMTTGTPPLYCQPVFADMVPKNRDLGTLPFRH